MLKIIAVVFFVLNLFVGIVMILNVANMKNKSFFYLHKLSSDGGLDEPKVNQLIEDCNYADEVLVCNTNNDFMIWGRYEYGLGKLSAGTCEVLGLDKNGLSYCARGENYLWIQPVTYEER